MAQPYFIDTEICDTCHAPYPPPHPPRSGRGGGAGPLLPPFRLRPPPPPTVVSITQACFRRLSLNVNS
jgi:hypothetical protein